MPVIYMARYLPFLRYRACYVYGTVPAMKRYCACYLLGQYLQFLRYRAHSVYGTVPAIFAVPCPLFIRDDTCHLRGTVPVIYGDSTCNLCGTVPILYMARYLQFLRYLAHSLYGTVPCLLFMWDGTCDFCGTVPIVYSGRYLPFYFETIASDDVSILF